jgi:hypothetical protein
MRFRGTFRFAKHRRIVFQPVFDTPIHTFVNMVSQIILDFFVAVFVVYEQQGVVDVVDLGLSYDGVALLYLGIQKQRNGRLFEKPRNKCGDFLGEHFFEHPFENPIIG